MMLLFLSLLLLLCSLLLFFRLGYPFLWKISLAATEFGHRFILLPLTLIILAGPADAIGTMTRVVSALTIIALLVPALRAAAMSRTVQRSLAEVFGGTPDDGTAFSWACLFVGRTPHGPAPMREVYARHGGEEQYLLFHRAAGRAAAPCIVIVHTGGWDSGTPAEFPGMRHFLAQSGYAVASISYRFAPRWPWPAQREDALAAIAYLKANAERLGIDAGRFVLFGRSAGGQIAAATAVVANDPSIKGCIAFYAPADMIFAYEHLPVRPDILDSRTLLHQFLRGPRQEQNALYHDASPYHHITPNTPPMLLVHGSHDPLTWYRQSARLSAQLTRHGVQNCSIELPWGTHAFDFAFNGPGGQLSRYAVRQFLSSVVPTENRS